jgi:acetyl esterase/lipase
MKFTLMLCLAIASSALQAAEPTEIKLWPEGSGGQGAEKVSLFLHQPEADSANRPAIIVCPGGGYGMVVMSYEGHDIAAWFAARGFVAFVLKYRVAPHQHPSQMHDVQRAMRYVRANAETYKVDPQRIGVIGFSAGGHLAATAGTKIADAEPESPDAVQRVGSRPDFLILAYPVISMIDGVTHAGSRKNLLGEHPAAELVASMSLEKQVTKTTPPTFILQTDADKVVPAENAILFYSALRKAGVPAEFHSYREGPHGVGLGRHERSKSWPGLLTDWLAGLGISPVAE